jgi:hypothetical protein
MFPCACKPPALRTVASAMATRFVAEPHALSPVDWASTSEDVGVLIVAPTRSRSRNAHAQGALQSRAYATARPAFTERMPVPHMDWDSASQVRQRKVDPPVTPEAGAQQREHCLVLFDRQQLTVAQRPAFGANAKLLYLGC